MWEALIHSILISEVKDTRSNVLQALWKIPNTKKTLKCHLELNFNNFLEKKRKRFRLITIIFSLLGLTILDLMST